MIALGGTDLAVSRLCLGGNVFGWTLDELHQELNRIRQRHGLSIDRTGERSMGFTSAAAAIVGPEGPIAAICLCPESNSTPLDRVAPLVLGAARRISQELFPAPGARAAGPGSRTAPGFHRSAAV